MDEKLGELRRRLDQKTTEIESVVAAEQGIGSIENMDPSDYERLQEGVEELLGRWEETAQEEGPGSMRDTPLNRLIAERFEIEQIILASRGQQGNDFAGAETQAARRISPSRSDRVGLSLEKLAREKPFCLTSLRSCETSSRLHGLRMICAMLTHDLCNGHNRNCHHEKMKEPRQTPALKQSASKKCV